jgi:ferric-dicitrate binding protein FerR (iron transport regulator)
VDISGFSVEDFVLDEEFRIWVLSPEKSTNIQWERLLQENRGQARKAKLAREIVLNLSCKKFNLEEHEVSDMWESIDSGMDNLESKRTECEVVPISPVSILEKYKPQKRGFFKYSQWLGVAVILILAFALSLGVNMVLQEESPLVIPKIVVYEEYNTPPGVKSTLTLQDGSKVMLNSGSSIRYIKNFEANQRELYLKGEAYFEVAKDSLRPFTVITDGVKTTALGTAFNISAYADEEINVSLVEGKVAVEVDDESATRIALEKGEGLKFDGETRQAKKGQFDTELILAWTKRKIIFQQVRMMEAIRILENWYGVKFKLKNQPKPDLYIYGVYEDEILENVLEGLSYTARFEYEIDQDEVEIIFK